MTIPPRFLDEIRNRLTLSDIIGKRVSIQRAGREFKACCPFHGEKTPSFTINDDKQFYHCFGCGAHGDAIGFVMHHDNLSFIDAVEMLSAEAGLQMPKPDPEAVKKAERAKDLHSLMEEATRYFSTALQESREGRQVLEYLLERGMHEDTIQAFRLGYAPADGQALRTHLIQQGYQEKDMIEAGVLKASTKGGPPYAFFRERVMFPVSDRRGRVVAFGGRVLPDHMRSPDREGYTPAKYINSSDTPLFDKGRMLYGEALARQAVRDGNAVIVTEGYMDVIACHQAGFKGAVAPMGTAMTEPQILSLWSMIPDDEKVPVLCFDGDDAGRRAASRACERILALLKPSHSVRFAFLPEGEDPDSLLKSADRNAFSKILDSALSLFDFIWYSHTAGRKFETPESRAGLVKALEKQVQMIPDRDVQRHYQELLKSRVSETFFKRYGSGSSPRSTVQRSLKPGAIRPRAPVFKDMHTRIFLAAVINHPHIFETVEEPLSGLEIVDPALNALRQNIISILAEEPELDIEGVKNHLKSKGFEKEMGDILSESVYVHAAFASPRADSETVAGTWLELFHSVKGEDAKREIGKGWSDVLRSSNEDDEEKLRNMVLTRAVDGN